MFTTLDTPALHRGKKTNNSKLQVSRRGGQSRRCHYPEVMRDNDWN